MHSCGAERTEFLTLSTDGQIGLWALHWEEGSIVQRLWASAGKCFGARSRRSAEQSSLVVRSAVPFSLSVVLYRITMLSPKSPALLQMVWQTARRS
jgi:hypothetical protein